MNYLINSIKNCITFANVLFSKLFSHTKVSVMTIATGWKEGKGLTAWHWRFYERIRSRPWRRVGLYREYWGSRIEGRIHWETQRTCGNWTRASPYYTDFRDRDAVANSWSTPSDSIRHHLLARKIGRGNEKWFMLGA